MSELTNSTSQSEIGTTYSLYKIADRINGRTEHFKRRGAGALLDHPSFLPEDGVSPDRITGSHKRHNSVLKNCRF